jgi:hypothetical protein
MDIVWLGGEGPGDIPTLVHLYLVTTLEVPAEDLVGLRSVLRAGYLDGKPVTFVRIYDPRSSEEAWQVKDFISLDKYPQFILYEGYWENSSDRVYLERRTPPRPRSQ